MVVVLLLSGSVAGSALLGINLAVVLSRALFAVFFDHLQFNLNVLWQAQGEPATSPPATPGTAPAPA